MDSNWLDELNKESSETLGTEKLEEMNDATKVIAELFTDGATYSSLITMLGIATGTDTLVAITSQYLTGCAIYREFMMNNGIDVDAIEQKALEEKRQMK